MQQPSRILQELKADIQNPPGINSYHTEEAENPQQIRFGAVVWAFREGCPWETLPVFAP